MTLTDTVQQIINGHEFEVSTYRGLLGSVKNKVINLKEDVTDELFSSLFTKICGLLGTPIYVHSYYGYIWKVNDEVLAYHVYEKNYHYEVVAFFILNKMPMGKKLKYSEYVQIDEVVKQVFAEHHLNSNNFIHYIDGEFMFWGESADESDLLILKPRSSKFYRWKKEPYKEGTTSITPWYSRREHLSMRHISKVKDALQKCFVME